MAGDLKPAEFLIQADRLYRAVPQHAVGRPGPEIELGQKSLDLGNLDGVGKSAIFLEAETAIAFFTTGAKSATGTLLVALSSELTCELACELACMAGTTSPDPFVMLLAVT